MSSTSKRLLAAVLCVLMTLGLFIPAGAADAQATLSASAQFTTQGGDFETAYVEWKIASGVNKYEVFYQMQTPTKASTWTKIDDELIRQYPGALMRADVLGLKAGTYLVKAVPDGDEAQAIVTGEAITVLAHDRNGFAFANGTVPGAYNADGTLPEDAVVVYVTDENKDTVSLTVDRGEKTPYTCTGIADICAMAWKKKTDKVPPIVIRFIGNINDPAGMGKGDLLIDANKVTCNVTFEGVGKDATFNGFGLVMKGAKDVEVRNLGVMNCNSDEGDSIGLQQDNEYIWVHNCDIFYGDAGSDGDQAKGDGALDTKDSLYVTHSYNHFWDCGKCNLQGGTASDSSNFITYHHNWFDHSDSRHPRVRIASVHVYNNFYDNNDKYGIGASLSSSVFSENNYFLNCPKPMLQAQQGTDVAYGTTSFKDSNGGVIKAIGNIIDGANSKFIPSTQSADNCDAHVVTSRGDKVTASGANGGKAYSNFDTDAGSYIPKLTPDVADTAMVNKIKQYAGRVQQGDVTWTFTAEDSKAGQNNGKGGWPYDGSPNPQFKAAQKAYTSSLVKVGGTVGSGVSTGPIAVTGVTLNQSSATLAPAATFQLKATVVPSTADNTNVSWSTADGKIATVSNAGLVTAVANGVVEITATTEDGHKTASCVVTVTDGSGSSGGGPVTSAKVLKASDFTMTNVTNSGKDSALGATEVADATENYFSTIGGVKKRNGNGGETEGTKAEFFEMPKSSTSGISFTVTEVPAKLSISWGSPKDTQKATLAVKQGDTVLSTETKGGKSQTTTLNLTTAGTYLVTSADDSEYSARVFSVTVTESGGTTQPTTPPTTSPSPSAQPSTTPSTQPSTQPSAAPVAVSGVKLNTSAVTLRMDGTKTATLTATVSPSNAANKSVTWTSSNTAVATVSATGVVTAVSAGTATITAKTADGAKTATCAVTVKAAAGASGDSAEYTLLIDDVFEAVKANAPEGWTTIDIAVGAAALEGQGTSGFFTIYPKDKGTSGSKFDKGKKFSDNTNPTNSLSFGGNAGLGDNQDTPTNSVMFTTTGAAEVKVWWIGGGDGTRNMVVLDDKGGTVATSKETASNSSAYISTMSLADAGTYYLGPTGGSNKICKVVVTVKSGGTTEPADKPVTGVSLDKTTLALATDGTKTGQLTATVAPADADDKAVTWSSSDEAVATVDTTGKVTAVGAGTATVTVTTADGGFTATCAVTVTAPSAPPSQNPSQNPSADPSTSPSTQPSASPVAVTGVKLNRTAASVAVGKTVALTATVQPGNATNQSVYWASSDTSILTVSQTGVVTGVKEGKADVTVTTKDGNFTETCAVTVTAASSVGTSSSGGSSGGGGGSTGGGSGAPAPTNVLPFVDVPINAWYLESVQKVYNMGLMKGTDSTHFAPNDTTTRAMVATVLYRLDGEKKANVAALFGDVVTGSWYEEAVKWAADKGVVKGYSEDVFAPDDNVTREQLVVMLYRYAAPTVLDKSDALGQFADAASISDWAAEAMQWAVKAGVINGKGDGTLDPQGLATRAEICAMLVRFVALSK